MKLCLRATTCCNLEGLISVFSALKTKKEMCANLGIRALDFGVRSIRG